jgi:hypothetical protein
VRAFDGPARVDGPAEGADHAESPWM